MDEQLRGTDEKLSAREMPWRGWRAQAMSMLFAVIATVAFTTGCGEETQGAIACTLDAQCPSGFICMDGRCGQLECGSVADCLNGDQGCISTATGSYCSAVECGCFSCPQCPVGQTCNNGTCGSAVSCGPTNPCSGTDVCDGGTCRACAGAECGAADCTVTGCGVGSQCNAVSKQCEPITGPTAAGCDGCSTAADCGTGWKCAPLPTGNACLPPCTNGNDCDTGWICQNGNCTPSSFRCDGCVTAGCSAAQACNPSNNTCIDAAPGCGGCANDWECGAGSGCLDGECVKRCANGTCAAGDGCTTTTRGVEVCDTTCASLCTPACSGATPICDNGTCVQCRVNGDCQTGQTCNTASGLCTGGGDCTGATPILWQGQCVQCVTNNDCNGQFCNTATNTCTSSQCAACAAPYPACVTIGTDSYCVQCATDEDCGLGGTCNTQTYACEGGTVTPTEKCTSDNDCDAGASGFSLRCDVASGFCYDTGGLCDDVTGFCPMTDGTVGTCISMIDALMGGGGMSFPIPGGTIPGFCGCKCTIPGFCIGPGNCRVGDCADIGALLGLPTNQPFCIDSSSLGF